MDINDNNAGDRNEEALLELERYNSEQEKEKLKDFEKEYNPRFEKLLNRFPDIELSYGKNVHNKVFTKK